MGSRKYRSLFDTFIEIGIVIRKFAGPSKEYEEKWVFTNEEVEAHVTRMDAIAFANGSYSPLTRDEYVALMAS